MRLLIRTDATLVSNSTDGSGERASPKELPGRRSQTKPLISGPSKPMRAVEREHSVQCFRLSRVRLERHLRCPCRRLRRRPHPCMWFEDERPSEMLISKESVINRSEREERAHLCWCCEAEEAQQESELALRLDSVVERWEAQQPPRPVLSLQVRCPRQLEQA